MTLKKAGKKQHMGSMWKKLMQHFNLDEPTPFVDHKYLGCTQLECKPNEAIIDPDWEMFESQETSRKDSRMVLRHGSSKNASRGFVNWETKRITNWYNSFYSMLG